MLDFLTRHLKLAKTNYLTHFLYATALNFYSLGIFITGTIHAFFPFLFEYTPYNIAKKICEITEKTFIDKK